MEQEVKNINQLFLNKIEDNNDDENFNNNDRNFIKILFRAMLFNMFLFSSLRGMST